MVGLDTSVLVHLEIKESPEHSRAHDWLRREILDGDETIALTPQVLTEFIHVVTDPKRFERPLSMQQAIDYGPISTIRRGMGKFTPM